MGMLGLRGITDDNFGMCAGQASLVTTWFMFGSKVAKVICMLILNLHLVLKIGVQVPELHHLWQYHEASAYVDVCMHDVHTRMYDRSKRRIWQVSF